MPDQNYYSILNIPPDADLLTIKRAYRKKALSCHPDRVPESRKEQAEEKFKHLTEAYSILCNNQLRQQYDRTLGFEFYGNVPNAEDISDSFRKHFGDKEYENFVRSQWENASSSMEWDYALGWASLILKILVTLLFAGNLAYHLFGLQGLDIFLLIVQGMTGFILLAPFLFIFYLAIKLFVLR